ncbi:MAG: hypothetical protein ACLQDF_05620 [Desulfomonilia bacterium]
MEKREGIVSEAGQNLFKVGDCFVKVPSGEPPVVSNGDQVVVVGFLRHGLIIPYACNNITKQLMWHQSYTLHLLAGIFVLACGIFVRSGSSVRLIGLGCLINLIGIFMIVKGVVILRAIRVVSTSHAERDL